MKKTIRKYIKSITPEQKEDIEALISLEEYLKWIIKLRLSECYQNQSLAVKTLGISRNTLRK